MYYISGLWTCTTKTHQNVTKTNTKQILNYSLHIDFFSFLFLTIRLLSVLRGHSVFSSPPQRPMTSDFEGFSIPDFINYIYFPILILEKEPVFSLLRLGHYWYHFYNVFGMTRSLTGDWTQDLPHSKPALYH